MGLITTVPTAGLANRMRAMASGIYIAKKLDLTTEIYWEKNNECFVEFDEIFQEIKIDGIKVRTLKQKDFLKKPAKKKNIYLPKLMRKFNYDIELSNFNKKNGNIFNKLPKSGKIYLTSYHSMSEHYNLTHLFKPKKEIQNTINSITNDFSSKIIGIHIRRTDNIHSISHNSIDDFKKRIDFELTRDSSIKFYLATDSHEVKEEFKEIYGNKIISYDALLNRKSVNGIIDAVIDLWCLSSTNHIIGSFYSSYSELAAELGGIELTLLDENS